MTPDLYWIPLESRGRLAISARPRGSDWLEDEVNGWFRAGIGMVVSMLTAEEELELELASEAEECLKRGIRFVPYPIPDRSIPTDRTRFDEIVQEAVLSINQGVRVVTHCRQGIGRSALFAVTVLKRLGFSTDEAIRLTSQARGRPIPETSEQADWLARYSP
jgi:protein-tyrosine phosphatase